MLARIGIESGEKKRIGNLRSKGIVYMLISDLFDYIPYDIQQYAMRR